MKKTKNGPLKITIFLSTIFATLAIFFGFRMHDEQEKTTKAKEDTKDYADANSSNDIMAAQKEFAKERDIMLQEVSHTSEVDVTEDKIVEKIVPTATVKTEEPIFAKKTKSS